MLNNTVKKIIIKSILENLEKPCDYKIFLFWSRVKWNHRKNSDYDIWIVWKQAINFNKLIRIKRKLRRLPYPVDLVDFNTVDEKFKKIALNDIIKWN